MNIEKPYQKQFLPFIDFNIARLNFTHMKIHQLIEEFKSLSQRASGAVHARTKKLSDEDFEFFKAQLGFTPSGLNIRLPESKLSVIPEF